MASPRRSDGEGSIYYDKTRDRYVASYVVGWQGGKPIRRKVSGKSRAAAASKLRDLRDKVNAGTLPAGRVPTVEQWLNVWLDDIAAHRVRPTTMPSYRSKVQQYLIPLLGSHRLDRLTPEHVEKAWRVMIDDKGLSPTTALQAHRILSRALTVAYQRGHVARNVAAMIDAPSKVDEEMDVLTISEAKRMIDAAKGQRNGARWSVAFALGLRPGEALGLRWVDVGLDDGVIRVRHSLSRLPRQGLVLGPVKSRAGKRSISLPDELAAEMRAHRKAQNVERLEAGSKWHDGDYVFAQVNGKPVDPRADWQSWRDLCEAAGVRQTRRYTARHTAATMLLAQGVAPRVVMDIMGHSQISVTSKYQHVMEDMQREAMKRQGAALWGNA